MEALKKLLLIFIFAATCAVTSFAANSIQSAFLSSYQLESAGSYAKAIETLKNAYEPQSYETNLRLGWLNYRAGLYSESLSYYQKAINIMPYAIEARFGYVYPASAMGNWDQVLFQYKEILKIDPNQTSANYSLGLIYYTRMDFVSASKNFAKIVNLYPMDVDSTLMLAWSNLKLNKHNEARALFNKVLLIAPNNKSATEGLSALK